MRKLIMDLEPRKEYSVLYITLQTYLHIWGVVRLNKSIIPLDLNKPNMSDYLIHNYEVHMECKHDNKNRLYKL